MYKIIILFFITCTSLVAQEPAKHNIYCLNTTEKEQLIKNKFWDPSCPVGLDRLRVVRFNHYNFAGEIREGKIIVLDILAPHVAKIFKQLKEVNFPINSADMFKEEAEQTNNTTAFICRKIQNSSSISMHSYGAAIDINPTQNPFVVLNQGNRTNNSNIKEVLVAVQPVLGQEYLNRANIREGMVEPVVDIFTNNGFNRWGGKWNTPIDWQHFEVPRNVVNTLLSLNKEDADYIFSLYLRSKNLQKDFPIISYKLLEAYRKNPEKFISLVKQYEDDFIQNPIIVISEILSLLEY